MIYRKMGAARGHPKRIKPSEKKMNAAFHLWFLDFKIVYTYLISKLECNRGPKDWRGATEAEGR